MVLIRSNSSATTHGAWAIWECSSVDTLTADTGYALDTIWVFPTPIPTAILTQSLSQVLGEYHTFSGRYNGRAVVLNDQGAEFTECMDEIHTVADVLKNHHDFDFMRRYVDYSSSILGCRFLNAPLCTVRLTRLGDGTCVLGVRVTHGVCDGDTFYSFMDRWAKLARGTLESSKVVLDQSQIPHEPTRRTKQEVIRDVHAAGWGMIGYFSAALGLGEMWIRDGVAPLHHKERTKPFRLLPAAVSNLKLAAELDAKSRNKPMSAQGLTSNEALCAFLVQLTGRVFDFNDATPMGHSTMYNWRGRLQGLSLGFAGNASSAIKTGSDFYCGSPIGAIVGSIHDELERYKSDDVFIQDHVKLFLDSHHYGLSAHGAEPKNLPYISRRPTTIVTNNFVRYPLYEVDFGTGKPELVVPHHCGDQVLIWPSPPNIAKGGIDLYFQGPTAVAIEKLLCQDDEAEWFHRELFKFSNQFSDKKSVQDWFTENQTVFGGDVHATTKKKIVADFQQGQVVSPIAISKRPDSFWCDSSSKQSWVGWVGVAFWALAMGS